MSELENKRHELVKEMCNENYPGAFTEFLVKRIIELESRPAEGCEGCNWNGFPVTGKCHNCRRVQQLPDNFEPKQED